MSIVSVLDGPDVGGVPRVCIAQVLAAAVVGGIGGAGHVIREAGYVLPSPAFAPVVSVVLPVLLVGGHVGYRSAVRRNGWDMRRTGRHRLISGRW